MKIATCLAVLGLCLPVMAAHDFVGEKPPEIKVGGWVNLPEGADRPSLESLRGHVVVLDFWHTTCNRCLAKVGKLRSLHEDYAARGLVVLALSAQNQPTLQDQTPKKDIEYLTAWDANQDLFGIGGDADHDPQWHNAEGTPETFLIAMDGTVVWQGPSISALSDSLIEEELARIEPMPELEYSDEFDKILKDIARTRYGKAHAGLVKLLSKSDDETETDHATQLQAWLEARAQAHMGLAEKAIAAEHYLHASEILATIEKSFSEMEVAESADALLKAWKKDKAIKNLIEAEKYLQMGKELKRKRMYKDAIQAFASVVKKAPDSALAEEAKAEIAALQE